MAQLNSHHSDAAVFPDIPCHHCAFHRCSLCANLNANDFSAFYRALEHQRRLKQGEYLHHANAIQRNLFAVRSGCLKSRVTDESGREQIIGFHLPGDLVGLGAISSGSHSCDAIAVEDSEVCGIPFNELEQLTTGSPALEHQLTRLLSAEITRGQRMMMLLGSARAEERVAWFLLDLGQRNELRGLSRFRFNQPMRRMDVASYLGLTLETVSRMYSRLSAEHVVTATGKDVFIENVDELKRRSGACSDLLQVGISVNR